MPLQFPGGVAPVIAGTSIRATDLGGKPIVVIAVDEVIQDHGLPKVQQVASDKYDNGQFEANGTIVVRTTEFS